MPAQRTSLHRALLQAGSVGPLGHLPASGTITVAVVGIPLYFLMHTWPGLVYVVVTVCFTAAAIWLHDVGDRIMGTKDSGQLVWDELVGFMIAVTFVPFSWQLVLLAFLMERVIDIVKVPPARHIERHWPGGWGVVGDDVVARLYTCGLIHLAISCKPLAVWLGM